MDQDLNRYSAPLRQSDGVYQGVRTPIDIEELVIWTYQRQRAGAAQVERLLAEEAKADGHDWVGESGDGVMACLRLLKLGTFIDGHAGGWSVDPDASLIDQAVQAVGGWGAALVTLHGFIGIRPEWLEDARFRIEPVWNDEPAYMPDGRVQPGSFAMKYEDRGHKPSWCPIQYFDLPEYVDTIRQRYTVWHRALTDVGAALAASDRLRLWSPTGPTAPAAPWAARGGKIAA